MFNLSNTAFEVIHVHKKDKILEVYGITLQELINVMKYNHWLYYTI